MNWSPRRSLAQTEEILVAPGSLHELQTSLIDGRLYRVYKNLWPSLREFWLWASNEHADKTYVVFESQRYTYREIFQRSLKAASIYQDVYSIRKGDRVGICSRNYPEYLVAFWACHLIGAVSVLANAWLPIDALRHCLIHTQCRLIVVDPERADVLESSALKMSQDEGVRGFVVLESHEGRGYWNGMENWISVEQQYRGDSSKLLSQLPDVLPEDNATVIFTSGTTGLPKGVLSTQRQFLTNVLNVLVGSRRAALRRGEDVSSTPPPGPQKGILVSVPFFHVTGSTSLSMMASLTGMKIVLMRKWIPKEADRLIREENIGVAGGVPSMVSDLTECFLPGYPLDTLMFGGAAAPDQLAVQARRTFPSAIMSQGYGLSETNSVAVTVAGEDYVTRPTTAGRPTPVNDVIIMDGTTSCAAGQVGEVWLRGPNVMRGYWRDPEATQKVITKDGWLRTGDLGYLDEEGFLYIKDRIKDIIIRGGENIGSVSVENALYADPGVAEAAAVGVPDKRLGELVAAVVSVKPSYFGQVTEESLIQTARKKLPRFAVPVMIIVQEHPFEHTPSGKMQKDELRKLAREEWVRRCMTGTEPLVKL
ncbi:acetyl-CoA synthetase-like protein [Pleurotus eryngii]|uniref:Acetyl-CoA synthetase-like protein n=1 Tax=Pleurotus eryngii TaxID=5323 RepID=A0A9P5ZWB5_PLEER|nr:acetyl-CoA synthetase-like protein [Pleurotus eryngii]